MLARRLQGGEHYVGARVLLSFRASHDAFDRGDEESAVRSKSRNSTATSCCVASRIMLASNRMKITTSSATRQQRRGLAGFSACWPLTTAPSSLSFLIANETHSREKLSRCKHSTYQILIENEFQRAALTLSAVEGSFSQPQVPTLNSQLSTLDSADFQRSAFN